jgi:CRISPR-associated protein Csb2
VLAFGIRYLTGFSAAAEPDDRTQAEWPPHPARVFMAMVAAHFQTGADPKEREALLWLEGTGRDGNVCAPAIAAPRATQRSSVIHYVPVNDKSGPSKTPMQSLSVTRERKERTFARAWLEDDRVYLLWPDLDPPESHRHALAALCGKVTRIGHSTSLVQMWLAEPGEAARPNWVPDEDRAVIHLRVPGPGTLAYLEQQYNSEAIIENAGLRVAEFQAEDRTARRLRREASINQLRSQKRPMLSLYHGYAQAEGTFSEPNATGTFFSPHFMVLQLRPKQGPYERLDVRAALGIAKRWRQAILNHDGDHANNLRALLNGVDNSGALAEIPHLALFPLAFVAQEYADGRILGMGAVLPADISRSERRVILRAIAGVRELNLGPLGLWSLDPMTASLPPLNLQRETWTAYPMGARHWSTVTPIVLDRHPKSKDRERYDDETAAMISVACTRVGLPAPRRVTVTHISSHLGVPPSFDFPVFRRQDGSVRRHTHASLSFDDPVIGPILIGAGRFNGYGVCRPLRDI